MKKLHCLFVAILLPGFLYAQAQSSDSLAIKNTHPLKVKELILPAVFITYGALSFGDNPIRDLDLTTKAELQEDHPLFAAHLDNYTQFAPALAVYALNLAGIKGKHSLVDATGIYVMSTAIMGGSVFLLKKESHRLRPDGSGYNSFPSGHTATVFAAAEFLKQEYKDVSPWYGFAGYAVATATGTLRMYNNKHWLSDVVTGAGVGILSTKLAYFLYPHVKKLLIGKQTLSYSMVPVYQDKSFGLSFHGTF
ncbi:phosphatase PAP2 family protein [Pedobacter sp. PLR]|uniref:phosphatase PAP2 family protein n=1 Tax=Pedobacter sp. PLR TaxID=2994465 RepID=UPI002247E946|nr:phosphatase PAP2 family protein [Pedobacter sp. PLR]MCX2453403.1 phosphatase PAP2 family protein [Pedobacter sp. PLR]